MIIYIKLLGWLFVGLLIGLCITTLWVAWEMWRTRDPKARQKNWEESMDEVGMDWRDEE